MMRRTAWTTGTTAAVGLLALIGCSQTNAAVPTALTTDAQKESYSLGVAVAQQARAGIGEVDSGAFVSGFADVMNGNELALDETAMQTALAGFEARRMEEARSRLLALAEANRLAGDAFRAEFAKDPAVVTTDSGMQYKVIEPGTGEMPAKGATVTLHYRGTGIDGREIDDTHARSAPVTMPLEGGLPGWSEALSMMPVGAKWQVVLPPELAFGDGGAAPHIEPGETLVFEIELISVS